MKTIAYTIQMPVAADELGRWLEAHGGSIEMSCALGTWHVTISQKKVLSYSDAGGQRYEAWEVSRYSRNMMEALEEALRAAGAIEPSVPR